MDTAQKNEITNKGKLVGQKPPRKPHGLYGQYLKDGAYMTDYSVATQFCDFLTRAWLGDLPHRYTISRQRAWQPWRARMGSDITEWWCESLSQARQHYSWSEDTSCGTFDDIAARLRRALTLESNAGAMQACLEIFKWGGVARKPSDASRVWVMTRCQDGSLVQRIKDAVALLQPDSEQVLHRFDGKDLLMNSAMTKVYAAADEAGKVVIYDGRVGAALGLLARRLLESLDLSLVPAELAFRWGAPTTPTAARQRTRDPSKGKFRFECLPNTSSNRHADRIRAELARSTGNILHRVIMNVVAQGETICIADLERALFMLGYDVRG